MSNEIIGMIFLWDENVTDFVTGVVTRVVINIIDECALQVHSDHTNTTNKI